MLLRRKINQSVDGEDGVAAIEISIAGGSSNLRDCPKCPVNPSFEAPYFTCLVRLRTAISRHSQCQKLAEINSSISIANSFRVFVIESDDAIDDVQYMF